MNITIGIIEDHAEYRQSLNYLVNSDAGLHLSWSFGSAEEALEKGCEAGVILLDINLPGISGLDAVPVFKKKYPGSRVIMLTIQDDDFHIFEAIKRGADGYLLKNSNPEKILEAIRHVNEGGAALTPAVARQVLAFLLHPAVRPETPSDLTPREKEVLHLITQGMTNDKIGEKLFISVQTVRNHIKSIYEKLQVHSRAQVVSKAFRERLV